MTTPTNFRGHPLKVQRADALVRAPAAFRKHGVYLSAADLEAA